MVIAAFICFAVLLLAWILAPEESARSAAPAAIDTPVEALPAAA